MKWQHPRMWDDHGGELDRILWRNRQWAVTDYGLENTLGPVHYHIPWSDVLARQGAAFSWPQHMAEKTWVDADMFRQAHDKALAMQQHRTGGEHAP